jgi:glyoxylase-like metal-dependent hydrolase (beta-lactamase superfamily II)
MPVLWNRGHRIRRRIVQVPVRGSAVFFLLDRRVTIVDAGLPWSAGSVLSALTRLGRSPDEVEQILITHYHPDHVGGLAALLRHLPARTGIHAVEADAVEGSAPMPFPWRFERSGARLAPAMAMLPHARVDDRLNDGDELPVLGGLRVVHLPGHTPGHIALHLPEQGVVISGDALQRRWGRLSGPDRLWTPDWPAAVRSVQRLAALDFDVLALSHFPPIRGRACEEVRRLAARLR